MRKIERVNYDVDRLFILIFRILRKKGLHSAEDYIERGYGPYSELQEQELFKEEVQEEAEDVFDWETKRTKKNREKKVSKNCKTKPDSKFRS